MSMELSMDMACPKAEEYTDGGRLSALKPGESAQIGDLLVTGALRRRLLDLGLVQDTVVKCVGVSPAGDPAAYLIRGAVIALRAADSSRIVIKRGAGLWA